MSDVPPFETIDHTADVGLVAYGRDLPELFANATRGMFHFIVDPATVAERETRPVRATAEDLEGLLVAWLGELLVLFNGDGFLPARFQVETVTPTALEAQVAGEPVDPARHAFRLDVKAVTYHGLRVEQQDGLWRARIIFDV